MVQAIAEAIRPEKRLLSLTWVQSNIGIKIPVAAIAAHLAEVNAERDEADQVLFGLVAVHGFGVETNGLPSLGVDLLMAGCHEWLLGPRGTGVVAFSDRGLRAVRPTIPTFDSAEVFSAWCAEREGRPATTGWP